MKTLSRASLSLAVAGLLLLLSGRAPAEEVRHPSRLLVLGPTGRPVEGAAVVVLREEIGGLPVFDAELPVLAITDAQGRVPELAKKLADRPGKTAGRLGVHAPGVAAALVPNDAGPVTVRLLRARPSAGHLRLLGSGAAGGRSVVALPLTRHGDLAHRSRIDAKGRFALPGLYEGRWRLLLRHGRGRLQSLGNVEAGGDLGQRQAHDETAVRGQLLDADGTREAPVAGVALRFVPRVGGGADGSPDATVQTDARGAFEIRGLAPGIYGVELLDRGWGFDSDAPRVQVDRDRERELMAWFARRLTAVGGRVLDPEERPLQGVSIQLLPDPALPPPPGGYGRAPAVVRTGADGRFRLRHVTPAEGYRLIASFRGFAPWVSNPFRVDRADDTVLRDVRMRRGWRLTVRVRDLRGNPVPDAEVIATAATRPSAIHDEAWDAVVRRGRTGADGRLELTDLPESDVLCRVHAAGMQPGTAVVPFPRVADHRRLDVELEAAAALTGQVLVPDGGPEGPFTVRAMRRDGHATVDVQADGDGRFVFPNLGDTATDVEVRRGSQPDGEVLVRVENVVPGVQEHLEILLPVLYGVSGSVIDLVVDGPAAQIVVERRAYDPLTERHVWRVVRRVDLPAVDDVLRFEIDALPAGMYTLRVLQGTLDSGALSVRIEGEDVDDVEILMPGGARIAGTVLDEEYEPVLGAAVRLTRLHGEDVAHLRVDGPLQRATDERGDFVFDDIAPGLWRVEAREEEHTPAVHFVRVQDGEVLVLEQVVLLPGGTLEGRLEDVDGRPLDGAHVHVRRFDGDEPERRVRTDHAGRYRLRHLRPGTYHVRVVADTVAGGPRIDAIAEVAAGKTTSADFTASRDGAIEGTVLRAGKPVVGALVDLVHDPRNPAEPLRRYRSVTRTDGTFAVEHLPAGPYRVQLQSGAWRTERAIELEPGDRLQLDLEAWAGRLRGKVVTRAGDPVPGAYVDAAPLGDDGRPVESPGFHAEGRSGPDGTFVLRGVPVGRYTVSVTAVGLPPGRREGAEADLPGADFEFEVVLGRGGDLNMQVRDENERGVTGARIWLEDERGVAIHRHAYVTGADGRLRIDGVPAGTVTVRVHARGLGRPALRRVVIEEGRQTNLAVIVYPAGALHLRVGAESGDPALRTRIDLLHAETGEVMASRRPLSPVRLASPWGYVPRTGELTLSDLEQGTYIAVISAGRTFEPARIPVVIESGKTTHVEVTLLRR